MRWKLQSLAIAGAMAAAAGAAAAQETFAPPTPPADAFFDSAGAPLDRGFVVWEDRPLPAIRDFPRRLLNERTPMTAWAVIACRAEADGSLSNCKVHSETPARKGVGEAAARLVRRGRLRAPIAPDAAGEQPTVHVTISYHVGG